MFEEISSFIISILSFYPVLGLAALGQFITQKSGVWNIGIEGLMAFSAFVAVWSYFLFDQSIFAALLFGLFVGVIEGILLSIFCIHYRLNQLVIGFGLWFLFEGLAGFLYSTTLPSVNISRVFEPIFLSLDAVFYFTIISFVFVYIVFKKTPQGLAIIASGERPEVAQCSGINVYKVRWICTIIGAGLMGLAGVYLAINILQGFRYTMVSGYGWMALAIVLFGRWTTTGVLFGTLLFSTLIGIQAIFQTLGILFIPREFMPVLPHIGVIVALFLIGLFGKQMGMPNALGVPLERK